MLCFMQAFCGKQDFNPTVAYHRFTVVSQNGSCQCLHSMIICVDSTTNANFYLMYFGRLVNVLFKWLQFLSNKCTGLNEIGQTETKHYSRPYCSPLFLVTFQSQFWLTLSTGICRKHIILLYTMFIQQVGHQIQEHFLRPATF